MPVLAPNPFLCPRLLPFTCPCPLQPLFLNHSIAIFNDTASAAQISVPGDAKMIVIEEGKAVVVRPAIRTETPQSVP
jgi:hypothetical protein